MSYNKKVWKSGDRITKEALNNMENGIEAAHQNSGGTGSVAIVDNLNSNSSTSALSAKQGKELNNKMPAKSIVEGGKIYLAKEDGTKLDSGTELPAGGTGTSYDDTEIKSDINTIKTDLGTEELTTTAKNVKGAVNEVAAQYKDIANKTITTEERTKLTNLENYDDTEIKKEINGKANTDDVRLKNTNITLNDCDSAMLSAIKGGQETSFELLSVPRAGSVTPEKTTFINNNIDVVYERGSYSAGVWKNDAQATSRVRCASIIDGYDELSIVRNNANYMIGYFTLDNGTPDGIDKGWIDQNVINITPGKELVINIKKKNNADFTDEEVTNMKQNVQIKYKVDLADKAFIKNELTTFAHEKLSLPGPVNRNLFTKGSLVKGEPSDANTRIRTDFIEVVKGDILTFNKDSATFKFGVIMYDTNKTWNQFDKGWHTEKTVQIETDGYIRVLLAYKDDRVISDLSIADNAFTLSTGLKDYVSSLNNKIETYANQSANIKANILNSVNVEYNRKYGASYVFVRIPKVTSFNKKLVPKIRLTSENGAVDGAKRSALSYSIANNSIVVINAGLFNTTTMTPQGQTIIDGKSVTNLIMQDDMGSPIHDKECYPLCIDAKGDLSAPYYRTDADTAKLIAAGVVHCVTGWGKIIDNFQPCTDTTENEIVHTEKYIRQSIGQFQNGDYFVCTVDMSRGTIQNEAGISYADMAQLLVDRGVKFAYSLDGGGSAETVVGTKQVSPIYEGNYGRAVPTVITFEIE